MAGLGGVAEGAAGGELHQTEKGEPFKEGTHQMHAARALLALPAAAAAVAVLALPGTAEASTIGQPFAADSGDACHYGTSSGTLGWTFSTTAGPLTLIGVHITGRLTDRPLPIGPVTGCPDDGYASTVSFTTYSGTTAIERRLETTDDATVDFDLYVGGTTVTYMDRIVVQVCRSPVSTMPPSYCGKAVTYFAPAIG